MSRAALVRDERGVALALAVISMLVLASLTASVVYAVSVNHRTAGESAKADRAFALAEQGLAYAEGRLYSAATSGEPPLVPETTFAQDGGTVTYRGTLSGSTWTLTGIGEVGGVTRTVSAQAEVPPPVTVSDPTIWNYFYVGSTSGCTTISGSVTINIPLYTEGSLCFSGSARFTGSDLEVGGSLSVSGAARIGTQQQPISKLNVVGSCSPAPCDGAHAPIWVTAPGVGDTLTPDVEMPQVDLPATYAARMGACQPGSGVPTPFFDDDGVLNRSLGSVNLFPPGQPYDCTVNGDRIAWDGAGTLTVDGTFFFDGSLALSGNTTVRYEGSGTIYLTGGLSMSGSSRICGIEGCTSQWDPAENTLIFVAGCWADGAGTLITFGCVSLSGSSRLQTGTWVKTNYSVSGTAESMGPVITDTASLSGNMTQMLPFASVPEGAPAETTTITPPPEPPTAWSG